MATLTSRTTVDNSVIHAWVDSDGTPWVEQPFNPDTRSAWETEAQAKQWADSLIATLTTSSE